VNEGVAGEWRKEGKQITAAQGVAREKQEIFTE